MRNEKQRWTGAALVAGCLAAALVGRDAGGQIIPPERMIDWAPGIPGGIPVYPDGPSVTDHGADGTDEGDDSAAFEAAIDACPEGQAVVVPAGTYYLSSGLSIGKSIVLRGEGPASSRLIATGSSGGIVALEGFSSGDPVAVTGGTEKGSTSVTVANASDLSAGDYVRIHQDNNALVDTVGCGGECTWCGDDWPNDPDHTMSQIVPVTAVDGNTLTLGRSLYTAFEAGNNPELKPYFMLERAGIEDIYLEMETPGDGERDIVNLSECAYCWLRNVETSRARNAHVRLTHSYGCEIRDSYFHHGHGDYGGGWAYGVFLFGSNSDNLIENNVFHVTRHAMVYEGGGSGNVFGYNYSKDPQGNVGSHWLFSDVSTHGAHPYMNLWEGNIAAHVSLDNEWGSSSHNTLLRNWIENQAAPPDDPDIYTGLHAVEVMANNIYENFVGNVLCHEGCTGTVEPPEMEDETIWTLGYECDGDSGPPDDPEAAETILRHGNFNYIDNAAQWDPAIADHAIPSSYYLDARPGFFECRPWPAIGPDLDPLVGSLPAKDRFEGVTYPCGEPDEPVETVEPVDPPAETDAEPPVEPGPDGATDTAAEDGAADTAAEGEGGGDSGCGCSLAL
jgi:hypothetical protein